MEYQSVLDFWFTEAGPAKWFAKSDEFDAQIRSRFLDTHRAVAAGQTALWRSEPRGRLAEIIVLDQFSRNMFRGSAEAFAYDAQALSLAQEAVSLGIDRLLSTGERRFLYMPYMHSESRSVHWKALWLFLMLGDWGTLTYEWKHKRIIDRFGRYPHRNVALGRQSTPAEQEWMKTHSGF